MHKENKTYSKRELFLFLLISILYFREYILLLTKSSNLVSVLFYAFIIMLLSFSVLIVFTSRIKGFNLAVLLLLLLVIMLMVFAFLSSNNRDTDVNNALIGRIVALIMLYAVFINRNHFSISVIKFNTFANIIYAWLFLFQFLFGGNQYSDKGLTFNYGNPNTVGIIVLLTIYSLIAGLFFFKSRFEKNVILCSMIGPLIILYLTNSRSAIFSLLLFVLTYLQWITRAKKKKAIKKDIFIKPIYLTILQAFVIIYPLIWATLFNYVHDTTITFFGKPLFSARELIWGVMLEELWRNPLISRYGQPVLLSSGPHNVFLSFWWDYGLIAFVLFNIFIWIVYNSINKRISTAFGAVVFALVLSLFLSMSFEAILFSGGVDLMFRSFFLLFFIGVMKEKEIEDFV